jgi:hypothetical protein
LNQYSSFCQIPQETTQSVKLTQRRKSSEQRAGEVSYGQ